MADACQGDVLVSYLYFEEARGGEEGARTAAFKYNVLSTIVSRSCACCCRTQLVYLALPVCTQCAGGCLFLYFSSLQMLRVLDLTYIQVTNLIWVLGVCRRSLLAAVVWSAWRHRACCAHPSKLATMATGQTTGGSCTTAADLWAARLVFARK